MIPQIITDVAGVYVLPIRDNTGRSKGGAVAVAATVVRASRGRPFTVARVTGKDDASSWSRVFGLPLHRSLGTDAEGLRHVDDAITEAEAILAVRVVAADYRYPLLSYKIADDSFEASNLALDASLIVSGDYKFAIAIVDGDASANRKLAIENVNATKQTFELVLSETLNGSSRALGRHLVSLDPLAKDDNGLSLHIESVLERESATMRATMAAGASFGNLKAIAATAFTGGTAGGTPTAADWVRAWKMFENDNLDFNMIFAAGLYDTTALAQFIKVAQGRYVDAFFDVPPHLKSAPAQAWLDALGLEAWQASANYCPFKADDAWYGGKTTWGASGAAVAAKARGLANFKAGVPGVHYAPAGAIRGRVLRRGMVPLYPEDSIDRAAFVKSRLNPVVANDDGPGYMIGDALALWFKETDLRFNWIGAIGNYIVRRYRRGAALAKFEPDGITLEKLRRFARELGDELTGSGALVTPRAPEESGTEPYVFEVKQVETDLWQTRFAYCGTGAARRLALEPELMR